MREIVIDAEVTGCRPMRASGHNKVTIDGALIERRARRPALAIES
jgi:hypothetical protein